MRRIAAALWILVAASAAACGAAGSSPATVTTTATVTVTAQPSAASTFDLSGDLQLWGAQHFADDGSSCRGKGGYSDIGQGVAVTVYDASGKIVSAGSVTGSTYDAGACKFQWSASGVPSGAGPYQVEVSHRGRMTVTEQDARSGAIHLTLGNS
ncbi:MAG: hypothetical protein J0I11_00805 [Actinobacteria bacterium]|nr:hypothetical protein [Actinomycetota bacterium]